MKPTVQGVPEKMSVYKKVIQHINGHFFWDTWYMYKSELSGFVIKTEIIQSFGECMSGFFRQPVVIFSD